MNDREAMYQALDGMQRILGERVDDAYADGWKSGYDEGYANGYANGYKEALFDTGRLNK